ncbi:MAG: mevalonate kinase, partial [Nitrososphaerales archaeon]|nr:mevalonate kinase [Nitrososphaerales archaeon]
SSASVAVATATAVSEALGHHLTPKEIVDLAMVSEKMVHKNPSGIDVNIAVYGGVILFQRNSDVKSIDLNSNIDFVIGYSGLRRRTSRLIQKVAEMKAAKPHLFNSLVQSSSRLSLLAANFMKQNDLLTLGSILNFHHIVLSWLGISIDEIDKMVEASLAAGALGAKVTGGGGGGCMIALPPINHSQQILDSLKNLGKVAFISKIPVGGVKVWSEKD